MKFYKVSAEGIHKLIRDSKRLSTVFTSPFSTFYLNLYCTKKDSLC